MTGRRALWFLLGIATACVEDVDLRLPPASSAPRVDASVRDAGDPDADEPPPPPVDCMNQGGFCVSPACPQGFGERRDLDCGDPNGSSVCCEPLPFCEDVGAFCFEQQPPGACPAQLNAEPFPCRSPSAQCCR